MKKNISFILMFTMAASLAGCGNNSSNNQPATSAQSSQKESTSKESEGKATESKPAEKKDPITLTWFNVGTNRQKDYDMAMKNTNKVLQSYEGLEHVSLDVVTAGWGDCTTKLTTMIGSGSAPDLFNPCAAGNVVNWVKKGACADLTELVSQYAPDVLTELPRWLLDTQTIDGKLYSIPTYQQNNMNYYAYHFPKDLADKYLDSQALLDLAGTQTKNREEGLELVKKRFDILTDYLKKCYDSGEIRKGATFDSWLGWTSFEYTNFSPSPKFGVIQFCDYSPLWGNNGNPTVVFNDAQMPLNDYGMTLEDIKKAAETGIVNDVLELSYSYLYDWFLKGYVREDVLSTKNTDLAQKKDGLVVWTEQAVGSNDPELRKSLESSRSKKFGFDVTIIPTGNTYIMAPVNSSGRHCVYVDCKYKEEAVKTAALMSTKKGADLFNAIVWGVEGTHYTKQDDGTIKTTYAGGSAGSDDAYGQPNWAWGNIFNGYINQATDKKMFSFIQEMHQTALTNKMAGFYPDVTAYETELALIKALSGEEILADKKDGYGSEAYRNAVKKHYQQLLDNGAEKIMVDIQRQVDEYLNSKK